MRFIAFAAAAFSLPLCGAQIPVGIFVQFDTEPAPASIAAMKAEVGRLMEHSGVRLDWRSTAAANGREPFRELMVVRFKGRCVLDPAPDDFGSAGETVTLATTRVENHGVLPFSEVECDQVRKVLTYSNETHRAVTLGRALGRVVAHEMYHVLARTTGHTRRGVARATQSWNELGARHAAPLDLSFRTAGAEPD